MFALFFMDYSVGKVLKYRIFLCAQMRQRAAKDPNPNGNGLLWIVFFFV